MSDPDTEREYRATFRKYKLVPALYQDKKRVRLGPVVWYTPWVSSEDLAHFDGARKLNQKYGHGAARYDVGTGTTIVLDHLIGRDGWYAVESRIKLETAPQQELGI